MSPRIFVTSPRMSPRDIPPSPCTSPSSGGGTPLLPSKERSPQRRRVSECSLLRPDRTEAELSSRRRHSMEGPEERWEMVKKEALKELQLHDLATKGSLNHSF